MSRTSFFGSDDDFDVDALLEESYSGIEDTGEGDTSIFFTDPVSAPSTPTPSNSQPKPEKTTVKKEPKIVVPDLNLSEIDEDDDTDVLTRFEDSLAKQEKESIMELEELDNQVNMDDIMSFVDEDEEEEIILTPFPGLSVAPLQEERPTPSQSASRIQPASPPQTVQPSETPPVSTPSPTPQQTQVQPQEPLPRPEPVAPTPPPVSAPVPTPEPIPVQVPVSAPLPEQPQQELPVQEELLPLVEEELLPLVEEDEILMPLIDEAQEEQPIIPEVSATQEFSEDVTLEDLLSRFPMEEIRKSLLNLDNIKRIVKMVDTFATFTEEEKYFTLTVLSADNLKIEDRAEIVNKILLISDTEKETIKNLKIVKELDPVERAFKLIELEEEDLLNLSDLVYKMIEKPQPKGLSKMNLSRELVKGIDLLDDDLSHYLSQTDKILSI